MKLSKNDILKLIFSDYSDQPIFNKLIKGLSRTPEFEFIRMAEDVFRQRVTICRKNTYLIG